MTKFKACFIIFFFFLCSGSSAETRKELLEEIFDTYEKSEIIDVLLDCSKDNTMTVQVGKTLYLKNGRQAKEYVTIYSVNNDLKRFKISPNQFKNMLKVSLISKREKNRQTENKPVQVVTEKIVDADKRHSKENPVSIYKVSAFVEKSSSTLDHVLIKNKNGIKFYETDKYEMYNLFKFIVLFFWYYTDRHYLKITYETNNGSLKKIVVSRINIEKITGSLNALDRKTVGNIRYDKKMAIKAYLEYKNIY